MVIFIISIVLVSAIRNNNQLFIVVYDLCALQITSYALSEHYIPLLEKTEHSLSGKFVYLCLQCGKPGVDSESMVRITGYSYYTREGFINYIMKFILHY